MGKETETMGILRDMRGDTAVIRDALLHDPASPVRA
jgi:hypothetical protein